MEPHIGHVDVDGNDWFNDHDECGDIGCPYCYGWEDFFDSDVGGEDG